MNDNTDENLTAIDLNQAMSVPVSAPAPTESPKTAATVTPPTAEKAAKIWAVASAISQENQRPALLHEVIEKIEADGSDIGQGTIGAQYTRWCTFYGVTKEMRKALRSKLDPKASARSEKAAAKVAEKEAAKAAKVAEKAAAKVAKDAEKEAAEANALRAAEEARAAVSWNKLPDDFNMGTIG